MTEAIPGWFGLIRFVAIGGIFRLARNRALSIQRRVARLIRHFPRRLFFIARPKRAPDDRSVASSVPPARVAPCAARRDTRFVDSENPP
ncbi:hypothetical protein [Burkholderia thailandensis]|uniref:hypothetical protein n=1 Tax=Burkholderia thailandensis TaxID=57975 RepID=UPI000AB238C8|nr:hypothetical protein [Burkholderia thailandensis]MCS3399998.1 hypothetical protein [Burkholderia thailandensis]MCS6478886.1 hypothetical protein [Burkholderia thailandensis]MCS6516277.1 hypothetical protein [Burkholderia thailandensis]NOK47082.1 hypothetical protein [Burkholderia thailandensis]QIO14099.1 hypothetical protein G9462_19010 [Burkholderia thailandensis]